MQSGREETRRKKYRAKNSQMGVEKTGKEWHKEQPEEGTQDVALVMVVICVIICISVDDLCSLLLGGWERLLIHTSFRDSELVLSWFPWKSKIYASVKSIAFFAKRKGGQKILRKT